MSGAVAAVTKEAGAIARLSMKIAFDTWLAKKMDNRLREIAADQRALADRQLRMGEELHARYIGTFAPIEDKVANFAITDWEANRYKPQYALHQGRAKLDAARAYGKVVNKLHTKFGRYTTGSNAHMIAMATSEWGRIEVEMVNRGWRFEEDQAWQRDKAQWGRLQNAIANGQRLPTQAAVEISAASRGVAEANSMVAGGMMGYYGALARGTSTMFAGVEQAINRQDRLDRLSRVVPGAMSNGSLGGSGIVFDQGSFGQYKDFNPDEAGLLGTADSIASASSLGGMDGITGEVK